MNASGKAHEESQEPALEAEGRPARGGRGLESWDVLSLVITGDLGTELLALVGGGWVLFRMRCI